jgi:hypothetical protein
MARLSSEARLIDKEIRMHHFIPCLGCLLSAGSATLACTADPAPDVDTNTNGYSASGGVSGVNHRHRPPQAAFDACAKLAQGASCQVTWHDRTIDGTCRNGPDGTAELACVPQGLPTPPPPDER